MSTHVACTLAAKGLSPVPILVGMMISGAIGSAIGKSKGRAGLGFVLGAFLGLIGWIIIGVMKGEPQRGGGGPFCSSCGQAAVWNHNYWNCARCQRPVHVAGVPAPTVGPSCTTCGLPSRWVAESNSWGCDRCRTLVAPPAPQPQAPRAN